MPTYESDAKNYEIMQVSSRLFTKLVENGNIVWPSIGFEECSLCGEVLYVGASLYSCTFIYQEYHTQCRKAQQTPLFKQLEANN